MGNLKFFQPPVINQPAAKRTKNFLEVSLGLAKRTALDEARRCPQCAIPTCQAACPLNIDILGFIRLLRESETSQALAKIKEQNFFPSFCGRVCSAPCEKACVFAADGSPIAIRLLERFAADNGQEKSLLVRSPKPSGPKIAVVGSGPSGLILARTLVNQNFQVTVFEMLPVLGGILCYGMPEFRLPYKVVRREIEAMTKRGVEFKTDSFVGHGIAVDELFSQGFNAVVLATGTGGAQLTDIPGADLCGVYYAEEILLSTNLFSEKDLRQRIFVNKCKKAAVVGKNYAALDCARIFRRLDKEVILIVDGPEEAIDVYPQDLKDALDEGVKLSAMTQVNEIVPSNENSAIGLRCVTLDYAEVASTGKWELAAVPGSESVVDTNTVILSLGHRVNTSLAQAIPGLKSNTDGTVWFSDNKKTSLAHIFVAGDAAKSGGLLVQAMASGKEVAGIFTEYFAKKNEPKK